MPAEVKNGKYRIPVDERGKEYNKWDNRASYPVLVGKVHLRSYCNNTFDFHWHEGPELSVVLDGRMEYLVNDKRYILKTGDCIFVNSDALHSGRSVDGGDCAYLVVNFLTSFLDSDPSGRFAEKYFGGAMDPDTLSSMVMESESEESKTIAQLCHAIYDATVEKREDRQMEIKGALCTLWVTLRRKAKLLSDDKGEATVAVARIKKAIRYMHENYRSKIGLEDIARACNLSKSEFCRCFKRITGQTPFDYLMDLRVRKSVSLLESEGCSVTEAALGSGFSGSSYYTEVFRRYMHCTPREYKKARKQKGS